MEETNQSWIDKNWKWFIPLLIGFVFAVFLTGIAAIFYGLLYMVKSSDIYQMTLYEIQSHAEVKEILGPPITDGWYFTGNVNLSGNDGEANIGFPVHGTLKDGHVYLDATKKNGKWTFNELVIDIEDSDKMITIY